MKDQILQTHDSSMLQSVSAHGLEVCADNMDFHLHVLRALPQVQYATCKVLLMHAASIRCKTLVVHIDGPQIQLHQPIFVILLS